MDQHQLGESIKRLKAEARMAIIERAVEEWPDVPMREIARVIDALGDISLDEAAKGLDQLQEEYAGMK